MPVVIFDESAAAYAAPNHPERPARVAATAAHLCQKHPEWTWIKPRPATADEVLRVHRPEHLERLRRPADFDHDTPYYPGIEHHALLSAGAAIGAVDLAFAGEKGFSLMRPPGHHATSSRAMGFCYLNSIAIATRHALANGCERVAIWDFDAHHGNGTEEIVLGDDRIRFASIHQHPCYPGTGTESRGNVFNWPVRPWTDPKRHSFLVHEALERLTEFDPGIVLVSAGFDAYAGDPLTQMSLGRDDFANFGQWLKKTGLPAASILEGGYSDDLPLLVEAFLTGWSD
jgi:acetoin utilization deacetylase AcuC-like enzyme